MEGPSVTSTEQADVLLSLDRVSRFHGAGIALVIGVPLLAILIGYLTTRSRLPLVRRLGQ
jgi:hypothetical protein